jgi:CheY-like chemotaxis protein
MSTRLILVLLVGEALENFPQLLRWLDSRGCRCELAQSYRDACDLVSCTQFDLVLSQYQLTHRTAFPLLDRLVGSPATLFFSARVEGGSLWLKMLDRGNRCVGTPLLRSDELIEALDTVLDSAVQSPQMEDAPGVDSNSSSTGVSVGMRAQ